MFTDVLVILFDLFDHFQSLFFMKGPYFSHFSLQAHGCKIANQACRVSHYLQWFLTDSSDLNIFGTVWTLMEKKQPLGWNIKF